METEPNKEDPGSTIFFCRVCQSVYSRPKLLPCLHSFCRACLVNTVVQGPSGPSVTCPTCSFITELPADGIMGLMDNRFLERICQEYVGQIKSHLTKSSEVTPTSGETLRSPQNGERYPSAVKTSKIGSSVVITSSQGDRADLGRKISDTSSESSQSDILTEGTYMCTLAAIKNLNQIQAKTLNMQGDALKVTYSIDELNQSVKDWELHKKDLKLVIERRCAQFQSCIKKFERQLIAQVDSSVIDDLFVKELDKCKSELRRNLKNILHEVSVLKCVQEYASDSEVNELGSSLLGNSVGKFSVNLSKPFYAVNISRQSLEDIVEAHFGELVLGWKESNIFVPDTTDFSINLDQLLEEVRLMASRYSSQKSQNVEMSENSVERTRYDSGSSYSSTSTVGSGSGSGSGLLIKEKCENLEDFQSARESFRQRRKEILSQGQAKKEELSLGSYVVRRPRSASREGGRVQSLDRATMYNANMMVPELQKAAQRRLEMTSTMTTGGDAASHSDASSLRLQQDIGASQYVRNLQSENIHLPSPVQEEPPDLSFASMTSSMPAYTSYMTSEPMSVTEVPGARFASSTSFGTSAIGGGYITRRKLSAENLPYVELISVEVRGRQKEQKSKNVRRSATTATDMRSKMDYLRENWQRRKEILLQTEGFVNPVKSPSPISSPVKLMQDVSVALSAARAQEHSQSSSGHSGEAGLDFEPTRAQLVQAMVETLKESMVSKSKSSSSSSSLSKGTFPHIDVSRVQQHLSDIQRSTPYTERTSYTERAMPYAERTTSYTERTTPYTERITSHTERTMPHTERITSHTERTMPYSERITSYTDRTMPYSQRTTSYTERGTISSQQEVQQLDQSQVDGGSYSDNVDSASRSSENSFQLHRPSDRSPTTAGSFTSRSGHTTTMRTSSGEFSTSMQKGITIQNGKSQPSESSNSVEITSRETSVISSVPDAKSRAYAKSPVEYSSINVPSTQSTYTVGGYNRYSSGQASSYSSLRSTSPYRTVHQSAEASQSSANVGSNIVTSTSSSSGVFSSASQRYSTTAGSNTSRYVGAKEMISTQSVTSSTPSTTSFSSSTTTTTTVTQDDPSGATSPTSSTATSSDSSPQHTRSTKTTSGIGKEGGMPTGKMRAMRQNARKKKERWRHLMVNE